MRPFSRRSSFTLVFWRPRRPAARDSVADGDLASGSIPAMTAQAVLLNRGPERRATPHGSRAHRPQNDSWTPVFFLHFSRLGKPSNLRRPNARAPPKHFWCHCWCQSHTLNTSLSRIRTLIGHSKIADFARSLASWYVLVRSRTQLLISWSAFL
jgi:hypothetical protein